MTSDDCISMDESDEIIEALRTDSPYAGPHRRLYNELRKLFKKSTPDTVLSNAAVSLFSFGMALLGVYLLPRLSLVILFAVWMIGCLVGVLMAFIRVRG